MGYAVPLTCDLHNLYQAVVAGPLADSHMRQRDARRGKLGPAEDAKPKDCLRFKPRAQAM